MLARAADPRRARARRRPRPRRRRHDRDRRRRPSASILERFRPLGVSIVSEEIGFLDGQLDARRRRPDRRLAQREARHPVLQPLDRGRRRQPHGRRPLRRTSTTSARARSGPRARGEGAWLERRAARRRAAEGRASRSSASRRRSRRSSPTDAARSSALAHRLRVMGSLALSLCHLAAGRVDGVCSLKAARSVDIAAGAAPLPRGRPRRSSCSTTRARSARPSSTSRSVRASPRRERPTLCRQIADALRG